jgi:hypothetical protein
MSADIVRRGNREVARLRCDWFAISASEDRVDHPSCQEPRIMRPIRLAASRRPGLSWIAAIVVPAVLVAGCGAASSANGSRPVVQTSTTVQGTVATLAAAGVATLANETAATPEVAVKGATVLSLTHWQVSNLAAEAAGHGGLTGAALDSVFPMPARSPDFADILGGWALTRGDPDEIAADGLLGNQGWKHPEGVVFPTEVLTLFVADALQHTTGAKGQTEPTGSTSAAASGAAMVQVPATRGSAVTAQNVSLATAPCSTVSNFVDGVLDRVFGLLKITAAEVGRYISGAFGGGVVGSIVSGLVSWGLSWFNRAVDLAEQAVKDLLKSLTQSFLNTLAIVIGGVAVIDMIRGYLKEWTAKVTPSPITNSFSVGSTAGNPGTFTVAIDTDAEIKDWPPQLVDCADKVGVQLPTLAKAGNPVTWQVFGQEPGLVTTGLTTGPLREDLTEELDYKTGWEKSDAGDTVLPTVTATVSVRRTEIENLRKLVTGYILGKVPGVLAGVVDPILEYFIELATKWLDTITAVTGTSTIVVSHHVPKPSSCQTNGKSIPAGTYAGAITAVVKTKMSLSLPSGTIPNAGSGSFPLKGKVSVTSNGRTVSGTMSLSGNGSSQVGLPGARQVHSKASGRFSGVISGPASSPVVTGTLGGSWASLDAPVINGSGSGSSHVRAGLHIIRASCTAISGDAVAMFAEFAAPVAQYISISGSGVWTAART